MKTDPVKAVSARQIWQASKTTHHIRTALLPACLLLATTVLLQTIMANHAFGHDVSNETRLRLANGNWHDYIRAGAEHMLTGYDHLLFLFGVVFFLSRFFDIVKFITAFTLGHTIVLIGATLARITADHYLIDAFIALTVAYKAFENLDGFQALFEIKPPGLLVMVFIFGLVHGFGLSTQLQTLTLAQDPNLVSNILLFNLGVELGQITALCVMVVVINAWRKTTVWRPLSRIFNSLLIAVGLLLMLYQLHGYLHQADFPATDTTVGNSENSSWHSHDDGPLHQHN
ncbi:MAG: HupE/UreJ family protein [Parahaliea sp.]